jgi:hypothetical protein
LKHTPGPWEFIQVEVWPFGVRVVAGSNVILHQDAFAHSTAQKSRADCEDGIGFEPEDIGTVQDAIREQDANARLIAAAPDLLAALEALSSNPYLHLGDLVYAVREKEREGWDGPAVTAWSEAVMAAKAAIAKARGE